MLASESLAASALACNAFREHGSSDHAPVTATFDVTLPRAEPVDDDEPVPAEQSGQLRLL